MSNDYALFIITIPNDFDLETSFTPISATAIGIKQESATPSDNTVSALMGPGAIPLSMPPATTPLVKRKSEPEVSSTEQRLSILPICVLLKRYLAERSDVEAVWMMSENKKTFQVTFYVEFGLFSDRMLQDLDKLGIGKRPDTKIFVLPTTIVLKGHNNEKNGSLSLSINSIEDTNNVIDDKSLPINEESNGNQVNVTPSHDVTLSSKILKRIHESDFKKSVRARLMVHQVVASIRASSAISFDFVLLICLASMLAAFGLLENSTVIIVASMLVSPLMNPILGIVFGLSVRDNSLWQRGLRNEIIGLIICITCGFLIGLFTTIFETKWGGSSSFPTSEMKSRGDVKRLWVGILIALPSGAGVALSVLGGNTGSLVGVAISASLLPPAVNCGLLFAYGLLGKMFSNIAAMESPILNNTNKELSSSFHCTKYINNDYLPLYTCNLSTEAAILAWCSLLLTIVNIICIIIMALIILRIKEVVPLHQPNKDITNFFHYDVKVVRDYNKTIHGGDVDATNLTTTALSKNNLAQSIINRWKTFKPSTIQQQQQQSPSSINTDLESTNHINDLLSNNIESRRKLFRFKTFAIEYDLDIFNKDDYNLTNYSSREKVRLLVSDLIDMCQEIPSVFVDLYRLQPSGTQPSSTDKEHMSFYQEIIEQLPPKWYQLFKYERQRRHITSWPLSFDQSRLMHSYPLQIHRNSTSEPNGLNLHASLKKPKKKNRAHLSRQSSVPESNPPPRTTQEESEIPVEGTRFRLAKFTKTTTTTTTETLGNESKLI